MVQREVDIDNQTRTIKFRVKGIVRIKSEKKLKNTEAFTVEAKITPTSFRGNQHYYFFLLGEIQYKPSFN